MSIKLLCIANLRKRVARGRAEGDLLKMENLSLVIVCFKAAVS